MSMLDEMLLSSMLTVLGGGRVSLFCHALVIGHGGGVAGLFFVLSPVHNNSHALRFAFYHQTMYISWHPKCPMVWN
jgi:hypothetical protein